MKILYLGVFQNHCSDQYRIEGFKQAGIKVYALDYRQEFKNKSVKGLWTKVNYMAQRFKPDLVFVNKGEKFSANNIKTLRHRFSSAKWVLFYGDHLLKLPDFLKENVKMYDGVLVETDDELYCGKLSEAGANKIFYHHSATDLSVFKKWPSVSEISDVAFFGNNYSTFPLSEMRRDMIKAILKSDFKLELYGASTWWGQCRGMRHGTHFSRAASRSKIILGISTTAAMNKFASNRVWNSMAVGFHLHHHFKGIDQIFTNHHHLVWFYDVEDMMDKIAYYAKHDTLRQRIYRNGLGLIAAEHTYFHRAEELKKIYGALS